MHQIAPQVRSFDEITPLLAAGAIFSVASFSTDINAFLLASVIAGYPHLWFTGLTIERSSLDFWILSLTASALLMTAILFQGVTLLVLSLLQPLHYGLQNIWIDNKKDGEGIFFWISVMLIHYLKVAHLSDFMIPFNGTLLYLFLTLMALVIVIKKKWNKIPAFIWALFLSQVHSLQALLAVATAWHGTQYILLARQPQFNRNNHRWSTFLLIGLIYSALIVGFNKTQIIDTRLLTALVLCLNLTHYVLDARLVFKSNFNFFNKVT